MVEKIIIITQARVGSNRLPKKILKKIEGDSLLAIHLKRLKQSKLANKVIVATTFESEAEKIIEIANQIGLDTYKGSENNVLDRFYQSTREIRPDYIVRVTSDCPLIDPKLLDDVINFALDKNVDYVSNTLIPDFPDGQDIEVIKWGSLEKAWLQSNCRIEQEHVTPFIIKNSNFNRGKLFTAANYACKQNKGHIRMTVDEDEDFECIKTLVNHLGSEDNWENYTDFIETNLNLFKNQSIVRNEKYLKSINNHE